MFLSGCNMMSDGLLTSYTVGIYSDPKSSRSLKDKQLPDPVILCHLLTCHKLFDVIQYVCDIARQGKMTLVDIGVSNFKSLP